MYGSIKKNGFTQKLCIYLYQVTILASLKQTIFNSQFNINVVTKKYQKNKQKVTIKKQETLTANNPQNNPKTMYRQFYTRR